MRDVPERSIEPPVEWEREPQCPVCRNVCEHVFIDRYGDICGCDVCGNWVDAIDVEECYE